MVLDGIGNPIPENSPVDEKIAEFIPTTSPLIFSKGPPELPGLIGASIWIMLGIEYWEPEGRSLPSPLIIPAVIEPDRPNGLPIAAICSPTSNVAELPNANGTSVSFGTSSAYNTARSVKGSDPINLA